MPLPLPIDIQCWISHRVVVCMFSNMVYSIYCCAQHFLLERIPISTKKDEGDKDDKDEDEEEVEEKSTFHILTPTA